MSVLVDIARAGWILGAPWLLGLVALRAIGIGREFGLLAAAAWSWLLGAGALAAMLWALLVCGVDAAHWWLAPVVAAIPLGFVARRRCPLALPQRNETLPASDRVFAVFALLGAAVVVYFAAASAGTPCLFGDEGSLWSLKAKALYIDWPLGEFAFYQRHQTHPDYPLLNPLLQVWVYSQLGAVDLWWNRFPIQLCILALWFATCSAVRRRLPTGFAILVLSPMVLDREFREAASSAYADGMVALGAVVALDAWLLMRERSAGDAAVAALRTLVAAGVAFALWSKNEALLYVAAMLVAVGITSRGHGRRTRWPGRAWILPAAVFVLQTAWNRWFGFRSDLLGGPPSPGIGWPRLFVEQFASHAPKVLEAGAALLLRLDSAAGLLLLPVIGIAALPVVRSNRYLLVPAIALVVGVVGLHVVYIGTWLPLQLHLDTSQARVVSQLHACTIVWLAAVIAAIRDGVARE